MSSRKTKGGKRVKGARIIKVAHRTSKREGWVMLDKQDMTFWAVAGDGPAAPYFESKDGDAVERWLNTQLGKSIEADKLDWIPVVRVSVGDGRSYWREESNSATLEVTVDRYWLALTHDKREWRRLNWEACDPKSATAIPELDRFAQSEFHGRGPKHEDCLETKARQAWQSASKPYTIPHHEGGMSVVRWTPELWAGLVAVVKQVKASKKALREMLATKAGLETVTQVGAGKIPLQLTATVESSTALVEDDGDA